jgi:hypothetical protein
VWVIFQYKYLLFSKKNPFFHPKTNLGNFLENFFSSVNLTNFAICGEIFTTNVFKSKKMKDFFPEKKSPKRSLDLRFALFGQGREKKKTRVKLG